ncbi:MAG: hypothetical protein JSR26_04080 [Proteobacteria bacterium]|nr:hypothetical protein [Pseudomonadota bacterium]
MSAPDNPVTDRADALHGPHYERLLTPAVVLDFLADRPGAANGMTARQVVQAICGFSTAFGERRLRTIVVALREAGHAVCADPTHGYFMATTDAELDAACEFLYDRALTSLRQISAMKRVALPDLRGQLALAIHEEKTA